MQALLAAEAADLRTPDIEDLMKVGGWAAGGGGGRVSSTRTHNKLI